MTFGAHLSLTDSIYIHDYAKSRVLQMAAVARSTVPVPPSKGTKGELAGMAGYGQKRRYYTPQEVAMHNCTDDCWVTVLGKTEY